MILKGSCWHMTFLRGPSGKMTISDFILSGGPIHATWKKVLAKISNVVVACDLSGRMTISVEGIHRLHVYQVSVLSSELGPLTCTPSHASEWVSSLYPKGGGGEGNTRLRVREWGDPIPRKGQKLWYSVTISDNAVSKYCSFHLIIKVSFNLWKK